MPDSSQGQDFDLSDRRNSTRFPLRLSVRYRLIGPEPPEWNVTESLNISSTGILFTTEAAVKPGQGIEAFVTWPAALDRRVPLKLALKGPAVRCIGNLTAMRFERYEFKTRSADVFPGV
jgi:hypothetical protein